MPSVTMAPRGQCGHTRVMCLTPELARLAQTTRNLTHFLIASHRLLRITPPAISETAVEIGHTSHRIVDIGQRQIKRSALDTFTTGEELTGVGEGATAVADCVRGEDAYDSEDYKDQEKDESVRRVGQDQWSASLMDHYSTG